MHRDNAQVRQKQEHAQVRAAASIRGNVLAVRLTMAHYERDREPGEYEPVPARELVDALVQEDEIGEVKEPVMNREEVGGGARTLRCFGHRLVVRGEPFSREVV